MKAYKKSLVILTFIIFIIFIFPINSKAESDVNYTFESEVLYNETSMPNDNNFNLMDNISTYSQDYNGSYSFTNETEYTSGSDIIFVDSSVIDADTSLQIINNIDDHNKVLEINDTSNTGGVDVFHTSFDNVSGTIEFWWRQSTNTDVSVFYLYDDGVNTALSLQMYSDGQYKWYDGAGHNVRAYTSNTWYHHRIDFECSGSGYHGLGADKFDWYINGILEADDISFRGVCTSLDKMYIASSTTPTDYKVYFDGFGLNRLSNYSINVNIIPIIQVDNSIKQIKGYEFAFQSVNSLYAQGYGAHLSLIEGWEISGGNVKIDYDYTSIVQGIGVMTFTKYRDRVVNFTDCDGGGFVGGYLDLDSFFNPVNNFIDVSYVINITHYSENGGYIPIEYWSEANQLLELRIYKTGDSINFAYFDGGYNILYPGLSRNTTYEISVLFNFEIDICYITIYESGTLLDFTLLSLFAIGDNRLDETFIGTEASGNHIGLNLDSVSVYSNGTTAIYPDKTYGYMRISTIDKWISYKYNLFSIIAEGNLQTYIEVWHEILFGHATLSLVIDSFKIHDNTISNNNIYDYTTPGWPVWFESSLLIYTKQNLSFSYVNIEGVSLNHGINKFWLEFDHSGVDIDESYFYVDTNNKLQFKHISNDTNLEYIEANFNIIDISTFERSISFKGAILDNAYGYLAIEFHPIGANIFDIPTFEKTTRSLITQNRSITDITILITDNDQDVVSGLTSGFVSNISFLSITGIGITIITAGLLAMMVPLILILIPTLLLSSKLGKKLIIPLFLVFTLLLTATSVIPVWVFFIVAYGCGLFIMLNKRYDD